MEDYTYDLDPDDPKVLGAHMLEVCPSIAAERPSCEIHPLVDRREGRPRPARVHGRAGTGVRGQPGRPRRPLPPGRERGRGGPARRTTSRGCRSPGPCGGRSRAWRRPRRPGSLAGGAHHTVLCSALGIEALEDLAEIAGLELLVIDEETRVRDFAKELRWNQAYYHLARGRLVTACVRRAARARVRGQPGDRARRPRRAHVRQRQRGRPRRGRDGDQAERRRLRRAAAPSRSSSSTWRAARSSTERTGPRRTRRPISSSTAPSRRWEASSTPTRRSRPPGPRRAGRSPASARPTPTTSAGPCRSRARSPPRRSPATTRRSTGDVIVETLAALGLEPLEMPAVLVASHGAVHVGRRRRRRRSRTRSRSRRSRPPRSGPSSSARTPEPIADDLLLRHFSRKHGPAAYYGQRPPR